MSDAFKWLADIEQIWDSGSVGQEVICRQTTCKIKCHCLGNVVQKLKMWVDRF